MSRDMTINKVLELTSFLNFGNKKSGRVCKEKKRLLPPTTINKLRKCFHFELSNFFPTFCVRETSLIVIDLNTLSPVLVKLLACSDKKRYERFYV